MDWVGNAGILLGLYYLSSPGPWGSILYVIGCLSYAIYGMMLEPVGYGLIFIETCCIVLIIRDYRRRVSQ